METTYTTEVAALIETAPEGTLKDAARNAMTEAARHEAAAAKFSASKYAPAHLASEQRKYAEGYTTTARTYARLALGLPETIADGLLDAKHAFHLAGTIGMDKPAITATRATITALAAAVSAQ